MRTAAAVLSCFWLTLSAGPAGARETTMREAAKTFRMEGGAFSCELPAGWAVAPDVQRARKIQGVVARGPATPGGAALLAVDFYERGNEEFADAETFVERQGEDPLQGISGDAAAKVERMRWKGRKARRVSRERVVSLEPKALESKRVMRREELVVWQHARGIFVLPLSAPTAEFAARRAAFERLLETFAPFPRR
ncbi:MAG: hypothetical protein HY554_04740 [Elusimicrobia bacterium]|nr:hypothetical protein [Elusimicrobiota bacterium]